MAVINVKLKKKEDPRIIEFTKNQENLSESVRRLILMHVKKFGTGDLFDSLTGIDSVSKVEIEIEKKNEEVDECFEDKD